MENLMNDDEIFEVDEAAGPGNMPDNAKQEG